MDCDTRFSDVKTCKNLTVGTRGRMQNAMQEWGRFDVNYVSHVTAGKYISLFIICQQQDKGFRKRLRMTVGTLILGNDKV